VRFCVLVQSLATYCPTRQYFGNNKTAPHHHPKTQIAARMAPRGYSRPQVEQALQFLQNEAHAYTTCDDFHWRPT
jgi:hypothetical protein